MTQHIRPAPKRARAIEAVASDPNRTNVAIAKEVGCNEATVRDARKEVALRVVVEEREIDWVQYAKDHFLEVARALKESLTKKEWREVVIWLEADNGKTWRNNPSKNREHNEAARRGDASVHCDR